MSIKIEKKNTGLGFFLIKCTGHLRVYKVYKKNVNGDFVDVYKSTFDIQDSSLRVDATGYDSIIVVYDLISPVGLVEIDEAETTYSHFYTMSFKKTDIEEKSIYIDPLIVNPSNISMSISLAATVDSITNTFEFPLYGEYVASSSNTIGTPVSGGYSLADVSENQNFSIYIPETKVETELFIFDRNTIRNKSMKPFSLFVELKVFSLTGVMEVSPVVKRMRIISNDNK